MTKKIVLKVLGIALVGVLSAQAEIMNVDWGGNRMPVGGLAYTNGVAPLAYTGTTWNEWNGLAQSKSGLKDSEGNTTTVGYNPTQLGGGGFTNPTNAPIAEIMTQYSYIQGTNSITLDIVGLTASGEYRLAFVSQGDGNNQGGLFTIGAQTETSLGTGPGSALTEGVNYVVFDSVFADATGSIDVVMTTIDGTSGFAALNAMQIEAIPEPATLGLVVAMGGGLLFMRRRLKR